MNAEQIREVLRQMPAEERRKLLAEFLPELERIKNEQRVIDLAAEVIAERKELLDRLAK